MRRTVPPSAEIEEQIDQLLAVGVGENPRESLSVRSLNYGRFPLLHLLRIADPLSLVREPRL